MSYELYLHRSFDYQLSPAASNIIDGAPISRMVGNLLHDRTAPLLRHLRQEAWCQPASASVRPTTPAAVTSSSGATGVSSSSPEDSPLGSRGGSPPRGSDPRRPQVPCPTTHRTQWIWHSFGSAPVFYQHGSFSLRAAIYAAVGLSARTTHDPLGSTLGEPGQSVTLGKVERERLLRIEDVLQLAWEYGRLGWMGVVNVRLLPPAQHTRVPLCEVMMRTPWTEWSIQSDELVLSWCGFLTLLQRRQSHTASSSSSEPPLQRGESNGGGLRQLKIGAGVVVKNDLASGINLYWGLSGQAGRGLAFSGHVDVLRRLCCAVSTSVGPLELATRLRLNLITLHRTGLDVGLIYYPLKELPRTAVRVSSSTSGQTVALHVRDVSREWLSWWLDARELRRQEKLAVVQPATPATAAPVTKKPAAPSPAGVRHHSTKDAAPEASASVPTSSNKIPAEPSSGVWTSVGHIWGSVTHVFTGSPAPRAPPPPRQAHAAVRMLQAGAAVGVRGVEFGRAVAVAAPQYARLVLHRAWSLDWLETALRAAEVDVTVGITNGVGRGARGFGTYCVISTH